jgi:LuxR family maltose regulon positive regulatory protein
MVRKYKANTEKKYLSERMTEKMLTMKKYPLTVMEAPLGYGKTTCLMEFFELNRTDHLWQPVFNSSTELFWNQFCNNFSKVDEECSARIAEEGYPDDSLKIVNIAEIIGKTELEDDFFWIIDDYHRVMTPEMDMLFEIVARECNPKLHFILAGRRRFENNRDELIIKKLLLQFDEKDFTLTENECKEYFEECNAHISITQNRKLYMKTEGWITAISMAMQSFVNDNDLSVPNTVYNLFENSIYSHFDDDKKDFLLRVCVFDYFTKEQARFVRRKDDPNELLRETVNLNEFVKFNSKRRIYRIQKQFLEFLRYKLSQKDIRYRKEAYRHAADWCYLNGKFFKATVFYYNSGNFEDMLKSFERDKGESMSELSRNEMISAYHACSPEMRHAHPIANMIFAKQFFLMNEKYLLRETIEDIEDYIENSNLSLREHDELSGEYEMLMSFLAYNNVQKMNEHCQQAAKLLKRPSIICSKGELCSFGSPSVIFMFHRERGGLDKLVKEMYEFRHLYYKLTDNNSRGFEYLLEGEVEMYRENNDRAEILSYKAYNVARKYHQTGMEISALFLRTRVVMFKGNPDKGFELFKQIRTIADNSEQEIYKQTADLCIAYMYSYYNQLRLVEQWIIDGNPADMHIYTPLKPFYAIVYGRICIDRDAYTKYMGSYSIMLHDAREHQNLISIIYLEIYASISCDRLDMKEESAMHLKQAVEIAYMDGLVLPFIVNGKELLDIWDKTIFRDTEIPFVDRCRELYRKYEKTLNVIVREEDSSPLDLLTKREKEIALLVADGKTNIEIAKELNLAEITVKKSLSKIYARIGVNNRTSLLKKLNQ